MHNTLEKGDGKGALERWSKGDVGDGIYILVLARFLVRAANTIQPAFLFL